MTVLCKLALNYGPLVGRILIAFIFLQSGYDKVFNYDKTLALMQKMGVPMAEVLLVPSLIILLGGGFMILFGWYARWAALALIVFLVPATLYFHNYWAYPEAQQLNQFHHFVKNLTLIGAMFYIMGMGSGPFSLKKEQEPSGT